jgi:chromatin remodeling complex protein RSC6
MASGIDRPVSGVAAGAASPPQSRGICTAAGSAMPEETCRRFPPVLCKGAARCDIRRRTATSLARRRHMPASTGDKKKAAPKPAAGKKVEKPKSGDKPNALQKPVQPSKELAAVVGEAPIPRGEVVSKVWEHIRKHNLQNPENKREILADDLLKKVFGKDKVTMFEMNKHLSAHLK